MRIFQPMMFIGLGGTGCKVGSELERVLRQELCGPDGTELQRRIDALAPYQLPGCLQFVYADLAESEFGEIEQKVVPNRAYLPAAERTYHMVRDLVPDVDTYPEVAQSLRLSAPAETAGWLPPPHGEPLIGPLSRGAGQLPTIGRAALFETFRGGLAPARDSLTAAIGEINNARGQLAVLADDQVARVDAVDVFVACSVAGGTGSGLFYDYLHLIGDTLNRNNYRARIFPLIVMPSAFPEGLGGGRAARLNAARALLDLFRLVDEQNAAVAGNRLNAQGVEGAQVIRYPGRIAVQLRPSTVQTAVLFTGSQGMQREDLHRSMVSLMLSLVGTDLAPEGDGAAAPNFQSFADSFINNVDRGVPAAAGVGRRGVSTSSVASLTVPLEELTEIVSSRLLADAVAELTERAPGAAENNRKLVQQFFRDGNLDRLWARSAKEFEDPAAVNGADAILTALAGRKANMENALRALEQQLQTDAPRLAREFDPAKAMESVLGEIDLFRLRRVVIGDPGFDDEVSKLGAAKTMRARKARPRPPENVGEAPPTPAVVTKWWRRTRFGDPSVQESVRLQNEWYGWRTKVLWHAAWNDQAPRWEPRLRSFEREVVRLVQAFTEYAAAEPGRFARREKELFEPRVGVSYLLPRQGRLESFYESVLRRFREAYSEQNRVLETATAGEIVNAILGDQGWRQAYAISIEHGPDRAVTFVRDRISAEVGTLFRYSDGERRPLVPGLHALLSAAAGRGVEDVDADDLLQFREKLAGLVPGGYAPSGAGAMKILFSYPATRRDPQLQAYLQQTVHLPRSTTNVIEWRPIDAEFITAVMFRTSMGLTEVPEVQEVLRDWSDAVHHPEEGDFLAWRQRLDYRFNYLAASADDRVRILHHLLCVAWNGGITASGGSESPEFVDVRLNDAGLRMELALSPYGAQSSWGSVLGAYEEWVLADNENIRRQFAAELVKAVPVGVTRRPRPPHKLFTTLVTLSRSEPQEIERLLAEDRRSGRRRLEILHEFWASTFPAAMALPFALVEDTVADNLAELDDWTTHAART